MVILAQMIKKSKMNYENPQKKLEHTASVAAATAVAAVAESK